MTALITRYGALGVFLLMVPESACIPVPSEVTLLFSGFAVSQHWMSFPLAVLAATAGNVLGSLIAYAAGAVAERVRWARRMLSRSESLLGDRPMRAVFTMCTASRPVNPRLCANSTGTASASPTRSTNCW